MILKGGVCVLTKSELADYFKLAVPTIDRLMKKGLPYYKLPNGSVRFELEEVKQWLISQRKGE
jgi:excisionase family DNA binding protein